MTDCLRQILPASAPAAFNQALMELGALVCLPNGQPLCEQCPAAFLCRAFESGSAAAYPVKPQKKPRRQQILTLWILQHDDCFLLEKRSEKGVLHGLWQFPNDEGEGSPEEKIKEWGLNAASVETLPPAKHIFTHIEWHMQAYLFRLKERPALPQGQWADRREIREKYSLPAAFRHYDKLLKL